MKKPSDHILKGSSRAPARAMMREFYIAHGKFAIAHCLREARCISGGGQSPASSPQMEVL